MTFEEMALLMAELKVGWPEQEIDDPRIGFYLAALADLPFPLVYAAVRWWCAEERWFPKPGELRDRAQLLLTGYPRQDSFAGRVGLKQAVFRALETGQPLAIEP